MRGTKKQTRNQNLGFFDRQFFTGKELFTCIGRGSIGGKAQGLLDIKAEIDEVNLEFDSDITVNIPTLTVIATDYFDLFMKQNDLYELALSDMRDDKLAHTFQKADLPVQLVGDLRALISQVSTPLAIRSSSMLEDAMFEPFASVYKTKMIPNNHLDTDSRFRKLVQAIKYIYASTFFQDAKRYIEVTQHTTADEKMAVIIQEVVGFRCRNRFYPQISGVARSHNFYPTGLAKPEDGVVDLALGLGKMVVDEGIAWTYSPKYPHANPPYNSLNELLKLSQKEFWAIYMAEPFMYDPIKEVEFMRKYSISEAEDDGSLAHIASTYKPQDDKMAIGIWEKGPRLLDFAPILKLNDIPLNDLIKMLLKKCEESLGCLVEIEFAVTLDQEKGTPARFGFLQVRPMVVSTDVVEILPEELESDCVLLASESALGNGIINSIKDIVYVKPDNFDVKHTRTIAKELEKMNHVLLEMKRPYVLIGFGRWGSSDPSGGIPVNFAQISGAKVIVESTLPDMNFMLSQGSHFFHNITSFQVFYISLGHWERYRIDWKWLEQQKIITEKEFIRHVRLSAPLRIKVDGNSSRGVIHYE
jgi:phosphoenolpyruvate synthase/pyruvate phosphate dikinase